MGEFRQRVSVVGTEDAEVLREQDMVPRGAAVLTSAGALEDNGILAIAHAATGAMNQSGGIFEPTLHSIALSIDNSFRLMRENGFHRIAIPFLASGVFLNRIGTDKRMLAQTIVDACQSAIRPDEACVIVIYGTEDAALFTEIVGEANGDTTNDSGQLSVCEGSITDYSLHECPVIVNAANMEVQFGGGLSGVIGQATGHLAEIEQEARNAIESYHATA